MLSTPMTAAIPRSIPRFPPPPAFPGCACGGACGIPAFGVGNATFPCAGVPAWIAGFEPYGAAGGRPVRARWPAAPPKSSGVPISVFPFACANAGAAPIAGCPGGAIGVAFAGAPPENASKNARTFAKRSSGDFDSAFRSASFIRGGIRSWKGIESMSFGGTVMCCVAHSHAVFAANGRFAVSIS